MAALASETGFAIAAEAAGCVEHVGAVDPDNAGLELRCDVEREVEAFAPHRRRQSVAGVVGEFDGLVGGAERHGGENRAEHLFLCKDVGWRNAEGQCRAIEIALRGQGAFRLPAGRALFLAFRDEPGDALELAWCYQRADIGVLVERIADSQPRHARLDLLDEGVRNTFLDEQARAGAADLTLVEPDAVDKALDRRVQIGVLEDHEGGFAAELERQFLARTGGGAADDLADLRRAGERDLGDIRMLDDGRARLRTALDDIDDTLRYAGALADLGEQDRGQRCELGRLQHHRAAGGERGRDLPGQHQQGKVPRDDLADDAGGLVAGKLAFEPLRPAGVVDEVAHGKRHVDVAALADRLAIVDRFQHREEARVALHAATDRVENARPLVAAGILPFRGRAGRCGDGRIDVGRRGFRDLGQCFAGRRLHDLEALARRRFLPLAVDEQCLREIAAGDPAVGFAAAFGRRAVFHRGITFEDIHFGSGSVSGHGVAVAGRIAAADVMFELALDVGEQA